jgi:uncharacterized repeat protein (TIGR01451 family)
MVLALTPLFTTSAVAYDEPAGVQVDGLLDAEYTHLTTFSLEDTGGSDLAPGDLFGTEDTTLCYWAFVVDRGYNDNVYSEDVGGGQTNPYLALDGWTGKRNFDKLDKSDHAVFNVTYGSNQSFSVYLDYINQNGSGGGPNRVYADGTKSGQLSDSYGDTYAPQLAAVQTSLHWNILNSGWQSGSLSDRLKQSPPYDYNDSGDNYWEWQMIYEFAIAKSTMGGSCGTVTQGGAHNSPAKATSTTARVGDYVWLDANQNGLQDDGGAAAGIQNVTVNLRKSSDNSIVRTTQSSSTGYYIFVNLSADSYYVEFKLPSGYVFTSPNVGANDAIDSDADASNGFTPQFNLASGGVNLTLDAGMYLPASANPGIKITKYTNDEDADTATGPIVPVGSTVTWKYVVVNTGNVPLSNVVVTDDQGVTPVYVNGDTNTNSKLDTNETWTYQATGTAVAGQYGNIGTVTGKPPVGDNVTDTNPSHYFGSQPGITITKYTNDQDANAETGPIVPVGSTVTWKYVVANTGNVALSNITVTDDQNVTPVYVSGDSNTNGKLDTNEIWTYQATGTAVAGQYGNIGTVTGKPPVGDNVSDTDPSHYFGSQPGIKITKYTNNEDADTETGPVVPVGSTVTWKYVVVNTGNVALSNITVTDDQGVTPVYVSGDTNSNGKLDTNETWTYQAAGTAIAGQYGNVGAVTGKPPVGDNVSDTNPSHYFGETPHPELASLGDKVWNDVNQNGVQDGGEPGVGGVTVELVTTCTDSQAVGTTTTDSNGLYHFTSLAGGSYIVRFTLPNGYVFTTPNQGSNAAADNDADMTSGCTPAITLDAGENDTTWDAGIYQPATEPELATLGDTVWNDTNHNGVQDNGEAGVSGVTVELVLTCTDSQAISTTTTDGSGIYHFNNLAAGSYVVRFILPNGYVFTTPNQSDNTAADSDADMTTGCTPAIALDAGENDTSWDAGIYQPVVNPELASVGDIVWNDANQNGVQDNGEPGVGGVTVELLNACADSQAISTTTTDGNGIYHFNNLNAGSYIVRFTLPNGYIFTVPNQGNNPAEGSDADMTTGCTSAITLEAGENDTTWDAGIYQPTANPELATLGDRVWYDANKNGLQDNGEAGVAGVEVRLYTSGGTLVASQNTNSNGNYLFTDLQPGAYYVEFASVAGYPFTHYNISGNGQDKLDSDPLVPWVDVTISDNGAEGEFGAPLTYTFFYTNTDATLAATNVVISTTIPTGTSFVADASDPNWNCTSAASGSICTLTLANVAANSSGSALFTVLVSDNSAVVPEMLDIAASLTQATLARTEVVTLAAGETNLTVDAGVVRIESNLTTATPTSPTNLPEGNQPSQEFIFLPSVQSTK